METKIKRVKKPDLNTKVGRYYLNRQKGLNKKDSALAAGYADAAHVNQIEKSETYRAIAYKDELLQEITLKEISKAHAENIRQSGDRGARNIAIKMALEKIEPEDRTEDPEERVLVILK